MKKLQRYKIWSKLLTRIKNEFRIEVPKNQIQAQAYLLSPY